MEGSKGNGLHLSQSDSSKRPLTGSSTQNGLNALTLTVMIICKEHSVGFQDEDQLWFVVTEIDAGGVNHSADGIITYGGWGAGRWHIRANNGTQFRGKVYVDGNALGTTNFSNSNISGYQMYTIGFNRSGSKHSSWRNGAGSMTTTSRTIRLGLPTKSSESSPEAMQVIARWVRWRK